MDGLSLTKSGNNKLPGYVRRRLNCLVQDKRATDFTRDFLPSNKSQLAAQMNKNGFKINCQPFSIVKLSGAGELKSSAIKFIDFSQRRRVGFRGAFEFDSKHIMLANEAEIRILAYMPAVDGSSIQRSL